MSEEWRRIWEDCEGLLCEKEVSSVAEGGKVKWRRREELEYSGSLQKLFSSFFSLSLAFAFSISRMGMAADQSNRCGKDMSIFLKKITAKKTKVYTF